MTQIDLKKLEKKAFTSYHEDGLFDIGVGLFILGFGIGMLTEMIWLPAVAGPVAMSVWYAAKKSITVPRAGHVKFGPERYSRMRNLITAGVVVLAACVLLSTVVWYGTATGTLPSWVKSVLFDHGDLVIGMVGAGLFTAIAYSLSMSRLYAYAVITVIVFVLSDVRGTGFVTGALILGGLVTLIGAGVLIKFVHNNPVVKGGPHE